MKMSSKNFNRIFSIDDFIKIEDIIFLDRPILTHLTKNDRDYFKYLVDSENEYDLFLLFEIDNDILIKYLLNKITLYSIITTNKYFCLLLKEDTFGSILEASIVNPLSLDIDYLPSYDSYLNIEFADSSSYRRLFSEYNKGLYLRELRNNAFYLKFEPTSPKYSDSIGFVDLSAKLLNNVVSSYRNFTRADFNVQFRERIGDQGKLNKTFSELSNHIDPRIVFAAYGSFEIGIAVDTVMKSDIEDRFLRSWALEVVDKYKSIVLDSNIDDEDVERIISEYNDDDRRKIFEPLISIVDNSNFNFKVKDNIKSNYKKYTIKKEIRDKIVPKLNKEIQSDKELELVNFTVVVDKNEKIKKKINPNKSIFTPVGNTTYNITNENFEKQGFYLEDTIIIQVQIETQDNRIKLSSEYKNQKFSSETYSDDLSMAINSFVLIIAKALNLNQINR